MKTKGCLYDKTESQKIKFFKSLQGFYKSDRLFYEEQVSDLQRWELDEFSKWINEDSKMKKQMIHSLNILERLLMIKK